MASTSMKFSCDGKKFFIYINKYNAEHFPPTFLWTIYPEGILCESESENKAREKGFRSDVTGYLAGNPSYPISRVRKPNRNPWPSL